MISLNSSLQILHQCCLVAILMVHVRASCECTKITNWDDLRHQVLALNKVDTERQLKLLLCPFEIKKYQDEDTNHWMQFIPIKSPIHIQCQKLNPDDKCVIEISGPRCGTNVNCGRKLFRIKSGMWILWHFQMMKCKLIRFLACCPLFIHRWRDYRRIEH